VFLKIRFKNAFPPFTSRVPAVYLTWANSLFLAFFAFNGISNLRAFNVAFSSIPTAPTKSWTMPLFVPQRVRHSPKQRKNIALGLLEGCRVGLSGAKNEIRV
jgi:hypothetical protein